MASLIQEWVEDRRLFFKQAFLILKVAEISGDYAEFGSWGGQSLKAAYQINQIVSPERRLWAFDTFLGERPAAQHDIDSRPGLERYRNEGPSGVEAFYEACEKLGVARDGFTPVEGYFEDTLPPLGPDGPPADIALAYIDCNLYASTRTVLEFLEPRLKHGMIVAFDDYWTYTSQHVSGERLALHEFVRDHPDWNFVPYRHIFHVGQTYIVEDAAAISTPARAVGSTPGQPRSVPGNLGRPCR